MTDVAVLILGIFAGVAGWPFIGETALLAPYVVGHFFLERLVSKLCLDTHISESSAFCRFGHNPLAVVRIRKEAKLPAIGVPKWNLGTRKIKDLGKTQ